MWKRVRFIPTVLHLMPIADRSGLPPSSPALDSAQGTGHSEAGGAHETSCPQKCRRRTLGRGFQRKQFGVCVCVCTCARVHPGELGPGRDTFKPGEGERQATEKEQGNTQSLLPAALFSARY